MSNRTVRICVGLACTLVLLSLSLSLSAAARAQHASHAALPGAEWLALPLSQLADERGGFLFPSGLQASFGFERRVHVNGELVSALRVQVADLGRVTPDEARQLQQLAGGELIQIGNGNHAAAVPGGLVIQNTLDGQRIQVQSTLDVGVGTLEMLRALHGMEALSTASTTAVGGL